MSGGVSGGTLATAMNSFSSASRSSESSQNSQISDVRTDPYYLVPADIKPQTKQPPDVISILIVIIKNIS